MNYLLCIAAGGRSYLVTQRLFCEQHKKTLVPMHFSIASLHVDKHLIIGSKAMFDSLMQTDLHTSKLYNSIMILPEDENSQNSQ